MAEAKNKASLPVTTFISPEGFAVLAAAAGTAVLAAMPIVVVPGVLAYGILTYLRYDRWKSKQVLAEQAEPVMPDTTGLGASYLPAIQRLFQLQLSIFREVRSASSLHQTLLEPSLERAGGLVEAAVQLSRKLQQLDKHLSNQTETRLRQEGRELEGKLERAKDAMARGQFQAALSQHQQKVSVFSELQARRERIDAQLTHLELTLETASAQVVRIKSADAGAASDESARVVDSLQSLSDEVQALAETVEETGAGGDMRPSQFLK